MFLQGRGRTILLLCVCLGITARLVAWWYSIGSNDVGNWTAHGARVNAHGLLESYRRFSELNHPPFFAWYAGWSWDMSNGDHWIFARWLKVPGLVGEAVILWALCRWRGLTYAAAYSCLPAAIAVSAYHGNTDTLCGALALLSGFAVERRAYFWAGLAMAGALNVKVMALILLPALFLMAGSLRDLRSLTLGVGLGLTTFLPYVLQIPRELYRNMIAYGSNPDNWGVLAFLNTGSEIPRVSGLFGLARGMYLEDGRWVMLLAIVSAGAYGRFRKRWPPMVQLAIAASLFLILAPGFGVQYVAFLAPLLLAADLRAGLVWGWLSGIFVALVYWIFLTSKMPIATVISNRFPGPSMLMGVIAWASLIQFVTRRARAR